MYFVSRKHPASNSPGESIEEESGAGVESGWPDAESACPEGESVRPASSPPGGGEVSVLRPDPHAIGVEQSAKAMPPTSASRTHTAGRAGDRLERLEARDASMK
jgi:hypothetical protein